MAEKCRMPTYGGQAVMEGVMMRGSRSVAIAMRAPNQEIVIHTEPLGKIYQSRMTKIPFLRGLVMLWDALGLGMRAIIISSNTQTGEDEKIEGASLYIAIIVALALAVGLFLLTPLAIGDLIESVLKWNPWFSTLVEGIVRLFILIGYIWLVGRMKDISRVFAYHGAEHKTINAFEAGVELTPENVSKFSVQHPRCGTAFLLTLVVFSILLFSLIGPIPDFWRYASRIILLPVLAGLSYEYVRWTANHLDNPIVKLIVKPNLGLQLLTTRQPTLDMLEVAIAAFKTMRADEERLVT